MFCCDAIEIVTGGGGVGVWGLCCLGVGVLPREVLRGLWGDWARMPII